MEATVANTGSMESVIKFMNMVIFKVTNFSLDGGVGYDHS